ncbi:MAG: hypothetical protein ACRD97_09515 [Nitrososphaeraceae archaeon]
MSTVTIQRHSLNCNSEISSIVKTKKGTPYEVWYRHQLDYLCKKCYCKKWHDKRRLALNGAN